MRTQVVSTSEKKNGIPGLAGKSPEVLASESGIERLVTIFSALSDATRMEMFREILRRGEVPCSDFDVRFSLSKSTISYHTKILNAAGLISTRRQGRFFYYRAQLRELKKELPELARLLAKSSV